MAKCDACKHKTTEDGWMVCDCCVHEPTLKDRYEAWTNADRIRAMTDEELRDFLWTVEFSGIEAVIPNCCDKPCSDPESENPGVDACKQCLLDKLQQPCEEGTV